MTTQATNWQRAFLSTIQQVAYAEPLRQAAANGRLRPWTTAMRTAVIVTCQQMGWEATAQNHKLPSTPIPRSEYLAIDVMAFLPGKTKWRFPVAVMELENQQDDDYIAYTLWKLLCVRAALRVVYCYRPQAEQGSSLTRLLSQEVVAAMSVEERMALGGETLVVVGGQANMETFPYGFFRWWQLEQNTGRLRPLL